MKCGLRPTKSEFAKSFCKSAPKESSDTQDRLLRARSRETGVEGGAQWSGQSRPRIGLFHVICLDIVISC